MHFLGLEFPPLRGLHSAVLPGRGAGQLREMTGNAACQLPCSSGRTLLGIGSGLTLAFALSICLPGGLGSREGPRRAVSFWADPRADIGPGGWRHDSSLGGEDGSLHLAPQGMGRAWSLSLSGDLHHGWRVEFLYSLSLVNSSAFILL